MNKEKQPKQTELGQRLRQIIAKIVASIGRAISF